MIQFNPNESFVILIRMNFELCFNDKSHQTIDWIKRRTLQICKSANLHDLHCAFRISLLTTQKSQKYSCRHFISTKIKHCCPVYSVYLCIRCIQWNNKLNFRWNKKKKNTSHLPKKNRLFRRHFLCVQSERAWSRKYKKKKTY